MNLQPSPYIFPLLITGIFTLIVGVYSVRQRHVSGASNLSAMLLGITVWIFAYSLELSAVNLSDKIIWAKVAYLGIVSAPLNYALFILKYIGDFQNIRKPRQFVIGLSIIPFITLLLVWTNEWHHLIWSTISLSITDGLTYRILEYGPWYWIFVLFVYSLLASSSFLLLRKIISTPDQFRGQITLLIIGSLSPWLGNLLYISGISPFPNLDLTPFSFAISTFCLAWALFRFNLLDIVPVARGLVIERLESGIIVLDRQNRVADINDTAVALLQKEKKSILGAPITFQHNQWAALEAAIQEELAGKIELAIDQSFYEVSIIVLENGRLITLHNITQRKETELLLQQAKETAEAADKAKTNFLTNMSHEIRTPLNAVVGMSEMLRQTPLNANQSEMIDVISQSSDSLIGLINNILDFSQLEANNLTLNLQSFDLIDCIESSIEHVTPAANNRQLQLAYHIAENTPHWLVGDPIRLRQVLINLLENGIKFTEEGTVELFVDTNHSAEKVQLQFTVKDSGIGIALDQMEQLFSPFWQADGSMTRVHGGNGLGLPICKRLVTLMGGKIQLQSVVGQGTSVHFTAQFSLTTGVNPPTITLRQHKATLANKRLIVITKNARERRQISKEARMVGLEVYAAASSEEACYWINHTDSFDIALLDTAVYQDDPAIMSQLRHKNSALPISTILLVPSNSHDPAVANGDAKLFSGYLPSPIVSSQMYDTLLNVLSTSKTISATPEQGKTMGERYPLKILIAEDNKLNRRILKNMLGKLGYEADIATNGQLAVQAATHQAYNVILMDIQMPIMDGVEAAQHILALSRPDKRPYIIAVTAHALEGDREQYLAAGMNEYISKPITLNQLVEVLYQAVNNHNQRSYSVESATIAPAKNERDVVDNPIDLAELALLVGEDTDGFLKMMAPIFLEDTSQVLQALAAAVQQTDERAIRQAAHTLKGTSASMGMTLLAQLGHDLELMAKANDFSEAMPKFEQIQAEFSRVKAALAAMGKTAV